MVIQIHYNTDPPKTPLADRTTLRLGLSPTVTRPATLTVVSNSTFTLPPGQPEVLVESSYSLAGLPMGGTTLYGVFPHMHTRGTKMNIYAEYNGNNTCIADVFRWDFHWQRGYFLETPINAPRGGTLHVDCTYDTTGETQPVTFGEGTANEMCVVLFYTAQ